MTELATAMADSSIYQEDLKNLRNRQLQTFYVSLSTTEE
jgi:hypothetical protein